MDVTASIPVLQAITGEISEAGGLSSPSLAKLESRSSGRGKTEVIPLGVRSGSCRIRLENVFDDFVFGLRNLDSSSITRA